MPTNNDDKDLAPFIHQVALNPHLSTEDFNQLCDISRHHNFSGLCTSLSRLKEARKRLGCQSHTKLIAVIAFPFGFIPTTHKQAEAVWAAEQGAEELDVVPNFFALSKGETNIFAEELALLCETGLPVTVILDTTNMAQDQWSIAIEACIDAGVRRVQNGNGFGPPVSSEHIQKLSEFARNRCEIKAAGGIKNLTQAFGLIQAGATKLGTSFGAQLMQELRQSNQ